MEANLLISILGTGSVVAVISAIVNGFLNKRKLSAEATSIITQAAGGIVQNLQDDNTRLRTVNTKIEARYNRSVRSIRQRDEIFRVRLTEHMKWDELVAEKLRGLGIEIIDPPKLVLPDLDLGDDDYDDPTGSPSRES